MPIVTIQLKEGRSEDVLRRTAKRITDTFVEEMGSRPESVWVVFDECDEDRFFAGYKTLGDLAREREAKS